MTVGNSAEQLLKETFKLYAEARYTWSGVSKIGDHAKTINFSENAEFFAWLQFDLADLAIVRVSKLFDKRSDTWSIKNLIRDLRPLPPLAGEASSVFLDAYEAVDLKELQSPAERVAKYAARVID